MNCCRCSLRHFIISSATAAKYIVVDIQHEFQCFVAPSMFRGSTRFVFFFSFTKNNQVGKKHHEQIVSAMLLSRTNKMPLDRIAFRWNGERSGKANGEIKESEKQTERPLGSSFCTDKDKRKKNTTLSQHFALTANERYR